MRIAMSLALLATPVGAWETIGPHITGYPVAGALSRVRPGLACVAAIGDSSVALQISTNCGLYWRESNPRLPLRPTALEFSPRVESALLAVGVDAFASSDLGVTWRRLCPPVAGVWRGAVFPDSEPSWAILAGTEWSSQRSRALVACSTAAGWRISVCDSTSPSFAVSICADPSNPDRLLVGGYAGGPCIYLTSDAGSTWRKFSLAGGLDQPAPYPEPPPGSVHAVHIFAGSSDVMLAACKHSLYRTTNGGTDWHRVSGVDTVCALTGFDGVPGWAVLSSGTAIRRTSDYGAGWGRSWQLGGNVDIRFLAAVPESLGVALAATDQGVYRSPDGGWTWSLHGVLGGVVVSELDRWGEPDAPLYATTGRRVYRADAYGENWVRCALPDCGTLADVAAGPEGEVWLLASGETGPAALFASADSGKSWTVADSWLRTGGAVAVGGTGQVLTVGSRLDSSGQELLAVSVSTNGGSSWCRTLLSQGKGLAGTFAPGEPRLVMSAGGIGDTALVFFSADTGRTWEQRQTGVEAAVTSVLWRRAGAGWVAYCASGQGVYRSVDTCRSWQYSGLAEVRRLAWGEFVVMAVTSTGFYQSSDGREWWPYNTGLPTLDLTALATAQRHSSRWSFCGTNGSGVFREHWLGCEERAAIPRVNSEATSIAKGRIVLRGLDEATLFDAAGRRVRGLLPGDNDLFGVSPGLYFVLGGDGTLTRRVLVVR